MDWTPTELQQAVRELAPKVLADDRPWAALAEAELLGLDGLLETCSLLVEVGRAGARVPALETLIMGAPLRAAVALDLATVVSGALVEAGCLDPRRGRTEARGGRLYGRRSCVTAPEAAWFVVPTAQGLWAVRASEVQTSPQRGTHGDPLAELVFDGTAALPLGGPESVGPWLDRVQVGVCALLLGLSRRALELTAAYVGEREQFGRKIGTFQAVSQRAADAWIDTWAMEVTLWQAAWRLSEDLPCARELLVARQVAADGAHRVTAAAQHLHGGMGFDRDYPLHRYFLAVKQWEFLLGGAGAHLQDIGDLIVRGDHAAS
jgi:alkylation response protein AidB-like acyl-CoA dehydrogenase